LNSAPQDGSQVNQAAPRLDVRGFDFGAKALFEMQIIQPHGLCCKKRANLGPLYT
jgi:hypothetical protein